MMALFVWGRIRYDVVALLALLAAIAAGIVKADDAFKGFGDDIVIIVASALVISAAITRSGVIEQAVRGLSPLLTTPTRQVGALSVMVALMSSVMKNIGALSMLIPVAARLSRQHGTPLSRLLMPMSFASLLGGVVTLVGTSPNIIVSKIRHDIVGEPFRMFDFTPVGLPLVVAGIGLLLLTNRLLGAKDRKGVTESLEAAYGAHGYALEAEVPADNPHVGQSVAALRELAGGEIALTALIRGDNKRFNKPDQQSLRPGDRLMLQGDPAELQAFVERAGLETAADRMPVLPEEPNEEIATVEAVVTSNSMMVAWTPAQLRLHERFGVTVVAVSRAGETIQQRLKSFRFRPGDLLVLKARRRDLADMLARLGCLPLAGRYMPLGSRNASYLPLAIVLVAMGLMAGGLIPVPVAFFGAAVTMMATGAIAPRDAYEAIDWPVLVTLGALIPVSDSMRTTGATDLISGWLAQAGGALPPYGSLALVMVAAMLVTPFLNNAATVLVMGPVAASFAVNLGYGPDPFLMAVAIGAACDFLTPIGHQCNMLVWGPGGYKFTDYWRLGAPLSLLVVVLGTPLILAFWPLAAR
ncbi:MAG: permease [Hyphomicrobiales bacterium]|nr:permease [Hyphomicrobiales bacterium]